MSGSQLMPEQFDQVRALHGTVRDWIERSAVAQKNEHLLANLPYVDLMFAFGFATLGDHPTANALTEATRKVMVVPVPEVKNWRDEEAATMAIVTNFLFQAFQYRIGEAIAGRPHVGPLAPEVRAAWAAIRQTAQQGPVNNPYKLAQYVINRFREQFHTVEPEEQIDPYLDWTRHGDVLMRGLAELQEVHEPTVFVRRTREMFRQAGLEKDADVVRLRVLDDVLPLAARGGEPFVFELIGLVPESLATRPQNPKQMPYLSFRKSNLLKCSLHFAMRYRRAEVVLSLTNEFTRWVGKQPDESRFRSFRRCGRVFLRAGQLFAQRDEVCRLLAEWWDKVYGNCSVEDLRNQFGADRDTWGVVLAGLQTLAGGWLSTGESGKAEPILSAARQELLNPAVSRFLPTDYTELARAYLTAFGNDSAERGFAGVSAVFREIPLAAITNIWQTARYYSRFHLQVVEDAVAAVCQLGQNNPAPAIVSA